MNIITARKGSLGQGNALHLSVCSQGEGVCQKWGLHPGRDLHPGVGVYIQGVCNQGFWGLGRPPELEKRAVHIKLECFLVQDLTAIFVRYEFSRDYTKLATLASKMCIHDSKRSYFQ